MSKVGETNMYKPLICLAFILAFFSAAQAQRKFMANVQVQVISTKSTPQNDMMKTLIQELTGYVDVSLKDKDADYALMVFLEKIPSNGPAYFAVNFGFYKFADCSYKNSVVGGKPVGSECKSLAQISTIGFISEADIKAKAQEYVKAFNNVILEPERKAFYLNRAN